MSWPISHEAPETDVSDFAQFTVVDMCCGGAGGFAVAAQRLGGLVAAPIPPMIHSLQLPQVVGYAESDVTQRRIYEASHVNTPVGVMAQSLGDLWDVRALTYLAAL